MDFNSLLKVVQNHFGDGLVMIVGSGLSAAEGISGMGPLANHFISSAADIESADEKLWNEISVKLSAGSGLEETLIEHPPSDSLETWITRKTLELLVPEERAVISSVITGTRILRLTELLQRTNIPETGIPIITTNYDRLVEVACESAGLHVDTTAIGIYAGQFDHLKSSMASCYGIQQHRKSRVTLKHHKRAIVLKPHGSFDWYRMDGEARRCSLELDAERLIITPGLNKYRAGYGVPFDRHRELANAHVDRASKFLAIGYGFNDDHLQTHLDTKIESGVPTLILTRSINEKIEKLISKSSNCLCLAMNPTTPGTNLHIGSDVYSFDNEDIWDVGSLSRKYLK